MFRSFVGILLVAALPAVAAAGEAENILLVKKMVTAINERNFDALDGLVAPGVVRHSAATPGIKVSNLAEFKAFLKADLSACPDARQELELIFGCGEMVAMRAVYTGTQTGPMAGFPPSGKRMELPFMGILRIEEGMVAEIWVEWDNLNALTQLGHYAPGSQGEPGP